MDNNTNWQEERLYQYLIKKYGKTVISKSEMATELGISNSTLDLYIAKGTGIPPYKKLGTAKNAKVIFNILDIATFMNNTIKTY